MSEKQRRFEELMTVIQGMDSGIIQIHVYKGMPVKMHLVSKEVVLGGDRILDLSDVEVFSPRVWWKSKKT